MCILRMWIPLAPIHKPTWKKFMFVKRSETVGYVWIAESDDSIGAYRIGHLKPWTTRLRWAFHISHMLTQVVGRIKYIHTSPLGGDTWKLVPDFYCTSPGTLFPDFKLSHFAVRSCSHKYSCFQESCEYLYKSSSLRESPGDPWNRSQLS